MTFDGIRVTHAALDQAAGDMRKGVADITDRLARLDHELAPLRSDWAGSQQGSYLEAKRTWDTAINEMSQLLRETHLAVSSSREDYQRVDADGAKRFV